MNTKKDKQPLFIGLGLLFFVVVCLIAMHFNRPVVEETPSGYYTGVFHGKGGVWVTNDGRIVPPPPGAAKNASKSPENNGKLRDSE